jgi:hypothetical protein
MFVAEVFRTLLSDILLPPILSEPYEIVMSERQQDEF